MKRNSPTGTPPGWIVDFGAGGLATLNHDASGAYVVTHLMLHSDNGSARFRIVRCEMWVEEGFVTDAPPAPLEWLEVEANTPDYFAIILDQLHDRPVTEGDQPQRMRLPVAMVKYRGKKPESFYVRVAGYVRLLGEHGIPYGPRLALDNDVSESTVRSWVLEARKRGLLEGGS